ncbi:MAG TPA: helix-turn-helix transcriptional regulator [Bacilli bacterium]|nr:helix-turn-helix transcriptional regulator [Bacilli bacterium]
MSNKGYEPQDDTLSLIRDNARKELGQRIKKLREKYSLTQTHLADGICTPSMISQIESGRAFPSFQIMSLLAAKLEISVEALTRGLEPGLSTSMQVRKMKTLKEKGDAKTANELADLLIKNKDLLPEALFEIKMDKAECLILMKRYDEAIEYLTELIQEEKEAAPRDTYTLTTLFNLLGRASLDSHKIIEAHRALVLAENLIDDTEGTDLLYGKIYYNLGRCFEHMDRTERAIDYYSKAERIYAKLSNDQTKLADLHYSLGITFSKQDKIKLAQENLDIAQTLYKTASNLAMMNRVRETYAYLVTSRFDRSAAKSELINCISHANVHEDSLHIPYIYARLLSLALDDHNLNEADHYASQISTCNIMNAYDIRSAFIQQVLARFQLLSKNYEEAIKSANNSATIFDKIGLKKEAIKSLQLEVDAYEFTGDLHTALSVSKKITQLFQNEGM